MPLYTRDRSMFMENPSYLVDSIPHGQKETVAKAIGITSPNFPDGRVVKSNREKPTFASYLNSTESILI